MDELLDPLLKLRAWSRETLISVLDILVVSLLIYKLLSLIRGPRAWRVVMGAFIFVAVLILSKLLNFYAVEWVMEKAAVLAPVALVILLLPELRQGLEGFGKLGFWSQRMASWEHTTESHVVDAIVDAATTLAELRVGALIVIERGSPLTEIVENGVPLDARLTAPLLESIFYSGNPLHDGAVVLRGDRIVAGACRLPFSENPNLSKSLHMRHRAAVGMTEQQDCVAVVVSEERGTISYAVEGNIRRVSAQELREALQGVTRPEWTKRWSLLPRKEKRHETAVGKN